MSKCGPQGFWQILFFWIAYALETLPGKIAAALLCLIPLAIWPLLTIKIIGLILFPLVCFPLTFALFECWVIKSTGVKWNTAINTTAIWLAGLISAAGFGSLIRVLFF